MGRDEPLPAGARIVGLIRMYKNGQWQTIGPKIEAGRGLYNSIQPCFVQSLCVAGSTVTLGPSIKAFLRKLICSNQAF